jgi:16S rRNA (uracil1498-N3)-methyltransferase
MLVPVADRERMLWLAEKCTELQATSWRPVLWLRSASVSPRGSGPAFTERVRARMVSALTQSGGAWLPEVCGEMSPDDAVKALSTAQRIVLDPGGSPLLRLGPEHPAGAVAIAVGPEGGIEDGERARLVDEGFERASLGATILRFETAAIAALAAVRAARAASGP